MIDSILMILVSPKLDPKAASEMFDILSNNMKLKELATIPEWNQLVDEKISLSKIKDTSTDHST